MKQNDNSNKKTQKTPKATSKALSYRNPL